jgi:hypothetical protein
MYAYFTPHNHSPLDEVAFKECCLLDRHAHPVCVAPGARRRAIANGGGGPAPIARNEFQCLGGWLSAYRKEHLEGLREGGGSVSMKIT